MKTNPTPTGTNGRDARGRFSAGNNAGKGNPLAKRVQAIRAALVGSVSDEDVQEIVAALVAAAKAGDTVAAREILDRTIGKAVPMDLLQRVEALEELASKSRVDDEPEYSNQVA